MPWLLHIRIAASMLILCVVIACSKEHRSDCFISAGNIDTQYQYDIKKYSRLVIDRKVNVALIFDTVNYAKITAPQHLISGIVIANTDNSTLRIANENRCNWVRKFDTQFDVELHCTSLQQLFYTGTGNVVFLNQLVTDSFRLDIYGGAGMVSMNVKAPSAWWNIHTGTTEVSMHGDVGVSYVYDAALGPVDAISLATGYTFCTNKGTQDLYVNASKEIGATVYYTGNIFYTGKPYKVITTTLHSGKVIQL